MLYLAPRNTPKRHFEVQKNQKYSGTASFTELFSQQAPRHTLLLPRFHSESSALDVPPPLCLYDPANVQQTSSKCNAGRLLDVYWIVQTPYKCFCWLISMMADCREALMCRWAWSLWYQCHVTSLRPYVISLSYDSFTAYVLYSLYCASCPRSLCQSPRNFRPKGKKVNVNVTLASYSNPETLYNLVSGSWLAWANDTAAQYAAVHCPTKRTIGPAVCW